MIMWINCRVYNNLNNMNSHGVLDKRAGNSVLKKWSRHVCYLLGRRVSKERENCTQNQGQSFFPYGPTQTSKLVLFLPGFAFFPLATDGTETNFRTMVCITCEKTISQWKKYMHTLLAEKQFISFPLPLPQLVSILVEDCKTPHGLN